MYRSTEQPVFGTVLNFDFFFCAIDVVGVVKQIIASGYFDTSRMEDVEWCRR